MAPPRIPIKPKRVNVASSIPPFLRGNPNYEPFEMPTLEVILMEDMKNKSSLTQILNAIVKSGKLIDPKEKEILQLSETFDAERGDEMRHRNARLKELFETEEGLKKMITCRISDALVTEDQDNSSSKAKCRLTLDRLASSIMKTENVQVEFDGNDPSHLTNSILNRLSFIIIPPRSESLSLELMDDLLTVPNDLLNKTKYRRNLASLETLFQLIDLVEKRHKNVLFSFKNQRGGWKSDVFTVIKSCQCKDIQPFLPPPEGFMDIERIKHQISNLNVIPEIVDPDELDVQIKESSILVSSLKQRL